MQKKEGLGIKKRYIAIIAIVVIIFLLYEFQLFQWQIVNGQKYSEDALNQETDFMKLKASRGEIYDKNGEVLAGNTLSYSIEFNALTMDTSNRNPALMRILEILIERGEEWKDELPILIDENGKYYFDEERPEEIEFLKSSKMLNLQEYATADNCVDAMIRNYNCAGYSNVDTRNLLSVRYSMTKEGFSIKQPYVIAESVSPETVAIFSQLKSEIKGVETGLIISRHYGEDGTTAPHVIGTIGAITAEQYEQIQEDGDEYSSLNITGYSLDDTRGQSGIEAAFEEYLRGDNGRKTLVTNNDGSISDTSVAVSPTPGNTVHLTLDSELQRITNAALKENIEGNEKYTDCIAGGAVAIDIKTGGVLACSTYPTYDIEEYYNDNNYYNILANDDVNKPLVNRALEGAFAPGSVFKPLVAMASLQEGVIDLGTTVFCTGEYTYYPDIRPKCLGVHGTEDVYHAISQSCNVFFYDAGRRLNIKRMEAYATYFGLGVKTGVEIGESSGQMTNPTYYESVFGESWSEGLTINAAIGQQEDLFTPVQLATYCAAIANGGVRYETHFLDKITNYERDEVVLEYEPKVAMDSEISPWVINTVTTGMKMAATEGTASGVFGNYPVSIACKTGTAETYNGSDNLTFIAFAPADDPQIAVAVVLEHGGKGAFAMNVAKAMLDQYFGYDKEGEKLPTPSPEPTPKGIVDGANAKPGAFYDPDKDLPPATPVPTSEVSSEEENSDENGNEDENNTDDPEE